MKMKKILLFVLGSVIMLAGVWIGGYLCSINPFGTSYNFTSFATSFVITICGASITANALNITL